MTKKLPIGFKGRCLSLKGDIKEINMYLEVRVVWVHMPCCLIVVFDCVPINLNSRSFNFPIYKKRINEIHLMR